MNEQQIQLYVLKTLVETQYQVLRSDVVKALSVKPTEVDAAMAKCNLVRRVTANNGAFVRYVFV